MSDLTIKYYKKLETIMIVQIILGLSSRKFNEMILGEK